MDLCLQALLALVKLGGLLAARDDWSFCSKGSAGVVGLRGRGPPVRAGGFPLKLPPFSIVPGSKVSARDSVTPVDLSAAETCSTDPLAPSLSPSFAAGALEEPWVLCTQSLCCCYCY